jgi:hypothetical protein
VFVALVYERDHVVTNPGNKDDSSWWFPYTLPYGVDMFVFPPPIPPLQKCPPYISNAELNITDICTVNLRSTFRFIPPAQFNIAPVTKRHPCTVKAFYNILSLITNVAFWLLHNAYPLLIIRIRLFTLTAEGLLMYPQITTLVY